eukprot:c29208_g1_i1 orf=253-843(+)
MISRSYTNLLDLTASCSFDVPSVNRGLPKVMPEARVLSNFLDFDDMQASHLAGIKAKTVLPSSPRTSQERTIIVANTLPLHAEKDSHGLWSFTWDDSSLLLQMKDGFSKSTELLYVGCVGEDIDVTQRDEVTNTLLEKFNCVPVFIPSDLRHKYFDGFCKHQLWPLFHYMLPITPNHGERFDRTLWQAYVSVNKMF